MPPHRLIAAAALAVLASLAHPAAAFAQSSPGSVFNVAKVNVQAEAENAVEAKQLAIARGQRRAFTQLMKRLTAFSAYGRLPQLDDGAIDRMLTGLQLRQERNSATVYVASLDYNFEPAAVRDILTRFGVAFVTDRSPEISIVPVYVAGGSVAPGRNRWSDALAGLDLLNSLAPAKLAAPRPDMDAQAVAALAAAPAAQFERLQYDYRSERLIFAIVETDAEGAAATLRLIGRDAVGPIALARRFKIEDRNEAGALNAAAEIMLKVLEGRWKISRLGAQGALSGPQELITIELTAQFAGIREWRVIRQRLDQVPGVRAVEVKGLNPREATISLEFPGGADKLARAAAAYGLSVQDDGGGALLLRAQ